MTFTAVILAAGYSSRMKRFKPLLPVGDSSALQRIVKTLRSAGVEQIVVVTGFGRERLQPVLEKLKIQEAYNADYEKGMFSSIGTGLARGQEMFPGSSGFFLMPVDCPLISETVIQKMKAEVLQEADRRNRQLFFVPVYRGKKGHPLYVPSDYVKEICGYDGPGGLKAITDRHWDQMMRIPVEEEGCLLDMDTPEGYEEILQFLAAGCTRPDLVELAADRRIFLIRHGETRQHQEKMFIGQYDVPLSDLGRQQMKKTAEALLQAGVCDAGIYASDLIRAAESAEIIRGQFAIKQRELPEIQLVSGLREIALGDWDGQPIRLIKEKHPEEYARRGQDMFAFKTGNHSENFYDLQYRAIKALRQILQQDDHRDLLLVTHSGVIRALENNLKRKGVEEPWERMPKGSYRVHTQK